jgi:NADH-quinone oxidoreductase subunit C
MSELDQELNAYSQTIVTIVKNEFPEAIQETRFFRDELTLVVDRNYVIDVCSYLRKDAALDFNSFRDLSAVDLWPEHPRYEVNIHLMAMPRNPQPGTGTQRLRIKVRLEEHDASMPTLSAIWPGCAWYERETQELYGIDFEGHPDPRPLLLPDDWEGTPPMRRDVPVKVEEVAFSFNKERIYQNKPFAKE